MRAALLVEPGKIEINDIPRPIPGSRDVLIRVSLAGICGSDHSLFKGSIPVPLPVVPGHEAVGIVEDVGSAVTRIKPGDRVTIQPNIGCGQCVLCREGHKNICAKKIRIGLDTNGVFGEWATAPEDYVWRIPEGMPDEVAVYAEPLSVAVHALSKVRPEKGSRTLVLGAGVIGLLILQLAAQCGAAVTAMDLEPRRLALAKQLGAHSVIGPEDDPASFQDGFDLIYETCGAPPALDHAINLAKPKGQIVLIGLPGQAYPVSTTMIVRKELRIMGSIIYVDEFPRSIEILATGDINTAAMTSGRLPLAELARALTDFSNPSRVKTLIEIG